MDWKQTLVRLDTAARALQPLIDRFLQDGTADGLKVAMDALFGEIPPDVAGRPKHPLAITSKALAGSLRQAIDGRALFKSDPPEWWALLVDGVNDAFDDFDRELAILMKEGEKTH